MENNKQNNEIIKPIQNIKNYFGGVLTLIANIIMSFLLLIITISEIAFYSVNMFDSNVFIKILIWIVVLIIRIIPNVLIVVSIWMNYAKASTHNSFSVNGYKLMQIALIIKMCSAIIMMILCMVIPFVFNVSTSIYHMGIKYNSFETVIMITIFMILMYIARFVLYLFSYLTVSSFHNKKMNIRFKRVTPILCIIFGILLTIIMIGCFGELYSRVFYANNELDLIIKWVESDSLDGGFSLFVGVSLLLWGISGIQYANKLDKARKED